MATVLVSLLAAAIGLLGAFIAWGQWYTARQKLVLDLFDKRYERYRELRTASDPFIGLGTETPNSRLIFNRATYEMEYLFGPEVADHLDDMRDTLHLRTSVNRRFRNDPSDENLDALTVLDDRFRSQGVTLYELLKVYLHMTARQPLPPKSYLPTAIQRLKHRWHNRPDGTE